MAPGPHNRRMLLAAWLLCAAALCTRGALAEDLSGVIEAPGVIVRYAPGTQRWAREAVDRFPQVNRNALETLGITTNRRVAIHLYATEKGFRQAANYTPVDTLGVTFAARNTIIIDCSKTGTRGPNSFAITLRHEMIHIAFGRLMSRTGQHVPLWFNEGVACVAMNRLQFGDPRQLVQVAGGNGLFTFAQLSNGFPTLSTELELAYQQSESAVRFLMKAHGDDAVRRIVSLMLAGRTFDESLVEVAGGTDFEPRWRKYVAGRYTILAFISTYFSLFTILALLVIASYVLYRVRRHRIRARWEQEEMEEDGFYGF